MSKRIARLVLSIVFLNMIFLYWKSRSPQIPDMRENIPFLNFESRLTLGCPNSLYTLTTVDFERIQGISYARATALERNKAKLIPLSGDSLKRGFDALPGFGPVTTSKVYDAFNPAPQRYTPLCYYHSNE